MNRKGKVYYEDHYCGIIEETETGYRFTYDSEYVDNDESKAISKTLPLAKGAYTSKTMFSFSMD